MVKVRNWSLYLNSISEALCGTAPQYILCCGTVYSCISVEGIPFLSPAYLDKIYAEDHLSMYVGKHRIPQKYFLVRMTNL